MLSRIVEAQEPAHADRGPGRIDRNCLGACRFSAMGPTGWSWRPARPSSMRDRVSWRGWSDGPDPALADADLLCVPSRSEAFPLAILEAMSRGIPVAASAVCAYRRCSTTARAGIVVDPVYGAGLAHRPSSGLLSTPRRTRRAWPPRSRSHDRALHHRGDDRRVHRCDRQRVVNSLRVLWLSPWMRPLARVTSEALRRRGVEVLFVTSDQHPESDAARDYEFVLDPRFRAASTWPASFAARRYASETGGRTW